MKTKKAVATNNEYVSLNGDLSGNFTKTQQIFLGLQNMFAMSGVIIVPILVGLDVSVTLFCAGVGTLIYQFIDKGIVPAFLGGSFAFIAPLTLIIGEMGIPYAQGGLIFVTIFYFIFALLLKFLGEERVAKLFPPIVTGPIIMVLGLCLAGVGVNSAQSHWPVAIITFAIAAIINTFGKGLSKVLTIVIALFGGYLIAIPFNLVDFTGIKEAAWFGIPHFTTPKFDIRAIIAIAPAAIVPCIEHIGDVIAVGTTVGKDFRRDPGLPRSLFACGTATLFSAMVGGPSLTIHSENTGVLAVTRIYSPFVVRCGAIWMALLAFVPKISAFFMSIPDAVLGGVGILLYGMVASVGIRTLIENGIDFSESKNLITASAILVLAVGGATFTFSGGISLGGMAIAAIAGIILNLLLPGKKQDSEEVSE